MQEELLRIWAPLGKTMIYVTHSLEEALLLGDRVDVSETASAYVRKRLT